MKKINRRHVSLIDQDLTTLLEQMAYIKNYGWSHVVKILVFYVAF